MRVVFIQFDFLEVLLDTLVNFVGNLSEEKLTAFSGKKRNSLKTSINKVPKGMISTMARM